MGMTVQHRSASYALKEPITRGLKQTPPSLSATILCPMTSATTMAHNLVLQVPRLQKESYSPPMCTDSPVSLCLVKLS